MYIYAEPAVICGSKMTVHLLLEQCVVHADLHQTASVIVNSHQRNPAGIALAGRAHTTCSNKPPPVVHCVVSLSFTDGMVGQPALNPVFVAATAEPAYVKLS